MSRRSSRPSLRSLTRPLPRCLDTKHCPLHMGSDAFLYKVVIISKVLKVTMFYCINYEVTGHVHVVVSYVGDVLDDNVAISPRDYKLKQVLAQCATNLSSYFINNKKKIFPHLYK